MIDRGTNLLSAAFNIIFIGYPIRTSLGVVLGAVVHTLTRAFTPLLGRLSGVLDLSQVAVWEYMLLGVAILHYQTIHFYLFRKGSLLGENEDKALEIINKAKRMGVPEWRIQRMYIELAEKVLANAVLKQSTKEEIEDYLRPAA